MHDELSATGFPNPIYVEDMYLLAEIMPPNIRSDVYARIERPEQFLNHMVMPKPTLHWIPANTNVFLTLAQGCGFVIFASTFLERSYMVLIWLV